MAKFKCFQHALYMGKEVQIRGVSHLSFNRYRSGVTYDIVHITPEGRSYDYKNIPESHLTEIPKPKSNEVLQFVAAANLYKKRQKA